MYFSGVSAPIDFNALTPYSYDFRKGVKEKRNKIRKDNYIISFFIILVLSFFSYFSIFISNP